MAQTFSVGFLLENDSLFIEEIRFMNFDRESSTTAATRNNEQLLGPAEVAEWLGVSAGWVRDHATRKDPRIRAIKIGKLLRFRPKDVEDFLRESTENAA
jgi:excisionase family DNA binding protein